jgi:hypothetical protein
MNRSIIRLVAGLLITIFLVPYLIIQQPGTAQAAAGMYVSGNPSIGVGQDISLTINVAAGSDSVNAFDARFTYPAGLLDGVRGSYAGGVCTIAISAPDPANGIADISCGRPSGFSGTGLVATIVLHGTNPGSGTIGLNSCQVLLADGHGTDDTGSCTGRSIDVTPASTAPPTATPTTTKTPTPTPPPTPKPTGTPRPTPSPTPGGAAVGISGSNTPPPTPVINAPEASKLPPSTATPSAQASASASESAAPQTQKRSISQAIKDIFGSITELKSVKGNISGIIALMLTLIPVLLIGFATVFMGYRLYLLERRRRRTLDRLFELELSELAALEGKLDLLAEKGTKGRQEFKEEFQAVKENILRQIKPDYNRPVDAPKAAKVAPAAEEKK